MAEITCNCRRHKTWEFEVGEILETANRSASTRDIIKSFMAPQIWYYVTLGDPGVEEKVEMTETGGGKFDEEN